MIAKLYVENKEVLIFVLLLMGTLIFLIKSNLLKWKSNH